MSHPKVRLIVALSAAVIIASASTAQAANKKKSFAELLSPSLSVATSSSTGASQISQASLTARAANTSSGIHAATARGDLTFAQYRSLVYVQALQNRTNFFNALRLYKQMLFAHQLNSLQYNASRANASLIFLGYSTAFRSEYTTGVPYYFTTPIGQGPKRILPGPAFVNPVTPSIVPAITIIR